MDGHYLISFFATPQTTLMVMLGEDPQWAGSLKSCTVLAFNRGSVLASMELAFDLNDTAATELTETGVRQQLETGMRSLRLQGLPNGGLSLGASDAPSNTSLEMSGSFSPRSHTPPPSIESNTLSSVVSNPLAWIVSMT